MLRPAIAAHIYFCNTAQVNQIPVDPTNLDLNNSVLMLVRSQARQFTQICATGRLTVSKVMGYYQYVSGGCRITWGIVLSLSTKFSEATTVWYSHTKT